MKTGDLLKVHWGASNYKGEEGVDWGYAHGVATGEIRYWNKDAQANKSPQCGDINVLVDGQEISYNIGRCEVMS